MFWARFGVHNECHQRFLSGWASKEGCHKGTAIASNTQVIEAYYRAFIAFRLTVIPVQAGILKPMIFMDSPWHVNMFHGYDQS